MPKVKCAIEIAAGKLISAIQKEWNKEAGEPESEYSEEIMHKSHNLLRAAKSSEIKMLLNGKTVSEYLDANWVESHTSVIKYITDLEKQINLGDIGANS